MHCCSHFEAQWHRCSKHFEAGLGSSTSGATCFVPSAARTLLAAAVHSRVMCLCCILCSPKTVFAQKWVCKHCECCSVSLGFQCRRDPRQCIAQRPALTLRTVMRIMYPWSLTCPQMNQYVTLNCLMICTLQITDNQQDSACVMWL